jgi:hypothetical protein
MSDLIDISHTWKQSAEDLLASSGLMALLQKQGKVVPTGAFFYDLMLSPDIDLYVICDEPEKTAQRTLQNLIEQRYWNGYLFYDWVKFRPIAHQAFPNTYYVGLKRTHQGIKWKIDIWVISQLAYEKMDLSWITKKLNDKNKELILQLKDERNAKRPNLGSYEIYDAVLNKGLSNLADIDI